MDKQFVLDDKSFKALAAESRVNILKKLINRRMTLSELSSTLSLRNSTIKEHCNLLLDANLVKKIDEGYKWKYYELTNKGKEIINPNQTNQTKILITLGISAVIFASIILFSMQGILQTNAFSASDLMQAPNMKSFTTGESIQETMLTADQIQIDQSITITGVNYNLFAISVIFALVIGIFAGWTVSKKFI
jgi:DNA-binding transcriptional ArsR family regulator